MLIEAMEKAFTYRWPNGEVRLQPGQPIELPADRGRRLVEKANGRVKIVTSPKYKTNSHEVEMVGDFGRLTTKTDNVVCPDNPKTSYLAVLSGLQTLKQYCTGILIGT